MIEVRIPHALLAAVVAEAVAAPAREVCGLLFGDAARITEARACANVAADPACAFEIDPASLISAHRAARGGGPRLIGHYHSHPSGDAIPSAADLAAATPGQLWLIVGGSAARLWLARAGGFDEMRAIEP